MSEWEKVKLEELYEVHNGLSKGRQFFGTGFPFLTFSNVFNNWFLPEQLASLVQTTEKEREVCLIKVGDVFITRTSETMDELGMSSVALKDYPNATYNGFTKRLRPITDRVTPRYIGYYLRTPKFRGQFMAFSTMTTRASLANNDLLNMEFKIVWSCVLNDYSSSTTSRAMIPKQRSDYIRNGSLTSISLDTKTPKSWMACQKDGRRRN